MDVVQKTKRKKTLTWRDGKTRPGEHKLQQGTNGLERTPKRTGGQKKGGVWFMGGGGTPRIDFEKKF